MVDRPRGEQQKLTVLISHTLMEEETTGLNELLSNGPPLRRLADIGVIYGGPPSLAGDERLRLEPSSSSSWGPPRTSPQIWSLRSRETQRTRGEQDSTTASWERSFTARAEPSASEGAVQPNTTTP
ncbi:unnamed protein product [Boreogadus saida]